MPHRKISRPALELINIIYQVANIVNINDIRFIIAYGDEDDMDSIFGDVYKVVIKGLRNGQMIERYFIIKWISEPQKRIAYRNFYLREYAFHNLVAPRIIEIQRRFKIIEGLKISLPNCIYSSNEPNKEFLVFSSIAEYGYKYFDRFRKIGLDDCSLVIKTLAKLHALCFVLQDIDEEHQTLLKTLYQNDVQYSDPKSTTKSILNFYDDSVGVIKDNLAKQKLINCRKDIFNILSKCVTPNKFSTICHADCWYNNFLFRYIGQRPVDVIFVDYQISRYASPVTDLSYFFYMCSDEEFLEDHYERFINLYHKTLSAVLKQCNLDVNKVYPEDIFKQHLKDYSVLGLMEALISMKIITAVSDEAVELAKMRYEVTDKAPCGGQSQNESLFVKRVNGVVNDFFKRGYSLDAVLEN